MFPIFSFRTIMLNMVAKFTLGLRLTANCLFKVLMDHSAAICSECSGTCPKEIFLVNNRAR